MKRDVPVTFRSKVDGRLAGALLLSAAASVGGVIVVGMASSATLALVIAPLLLLSVGLPVWLLRGTDYRIDDTTLHVRCGPFAWRVPLREIAAVTPTRDARSSPALSLDRLRIDYGASRSIIVSPADKDAFLAELAGRTGLTLPR